jgi:hypothetical protein
MVFISFVFLNGVLGFDFLLKMYNAQLILLILLGNSDSRLIYGVMGRA